MSERPVSRLNADPAVDIAILYERIHTVDRVLAEREKQHSAVQEMLKRATDKAENAQAQINSVSNEWRGTLRDREANLATTKDLEGVKELVHALTSRVTAVEQSIAAGTGQSTGTTDSRDLVLRVLAVVITLIAVTVAILSRTTFNP